MVKRITKKFLNLSLKKWVNQKTLTTTLQTVQVTTFVTRLTQQNFVKNLDGNHNSQTLKKDLKTRSNGTLTMKIGGKQKKTLLKRNTLKCNKSSNNHSLASYHTVGRVFFAFDKMRISENTPNMRGNHND